MGGRGGRGVRVGAALALLSMLAACSSYEVIPAHLKKHVNHDLTYERLEQDPERYRGELVVLGGEVLKARRLATQVEVELLQLPLGDNYIPIPDRVESQGRFLAYGSGEELADPAILREGSHVTIIGEVTGSVPGKIDESRYQYPTVAIRDMTLWTQDMGSGGRYPYYAYGFYWHPSRPTPW